MRKMAGTTSGVLLLLEMVLLSSAGCNWGSEQPASPIRDAKVNVTQPGGPREANVVYLEQNWTPAESEQFYFTSQGSQILPYDWFLILEQTRDSTLFRDDKNLIKLGYLLQNKDSLNPDALPVGFVKDEGRSRAWLGLTCAACHTSQIDYQGVGYRIDGGPASADVRGFLVTVTDALKATRDQDDKFRRFAAKILGSKDSSDARDTLKEELTAIIKRREGYNVRNFPADAPPLPGRVDAFGAIMNEVFHHVAKLPPGAPDTANTEPANAPVSYPCLWDTPQHDVVQWNGVAKNAGRGSLGRNVGEVLGVFADFEIPDHPGMTGYQSSVRVRNLLAIEEALKKLWSPQWPSAFPAIDTALRDQGRQVFEKAQCTYCHLDIDRKDPFRRVEAKMQPVGTEDRMAVNFAKRFASTGKLEGAFVKVIGSTLLGSPVFPAKASAEDVLGHVVIGTIIGSGYRAPEDELTEIEYKRRVAKILGAGAPAVGGGGIYKARPLNGVWATAPYLHNGSVPTLYHLLLAPKDRPKTFTVGSREFDPKNVGFRTDAPGYPVYRARNDDGTPVGGNSNDGHEFGTGPSLTDQERWALVEYLKSL
jgi:hypothetical protein